MPTLVKRLLWAVPIVAIVAAVVVFGGPVLNGYLNAKPVETKSESSNTQVIAAITRTEQVALVSLGIQGIAEKTQSTTIFGMEVPGSERALFLQYTFNAKLGLDGKDVEIEKTGENEFTITMPEFIFIGHDDVNFKLATEKNGVLSWATPEIDTFEMTNNILSDEAQVEYVQANRKLLREQAKAFYSGIVSGIDPSIDLDFEFESDS